MRKIADIFVSIFKSGAYKYIIVVTVFLLAMIFSQKHNIGQYLTNARTIENLNAEKEYYISQTEKNRKRLEELKSDKQDLEKFARERYYLKSPDEDVFVISPE